jgi:hypothetical protein
VPSKLRNGPIVALPIETHEDICDEAAAVRFCQAVRRNTASKQPRCRLHTCSMQRMILRHCVQSTYQGSNRSAPSAHHSRNAEVRTLFCNELSARVTFLWAPQSSMLCVRQPFNALVASPRVNAATACISACLRSMDQGPEVLESVRLSSSSTHLLQLDALARLVLCPQSPCLKCSQLQ